MSNQSVQTVIGRAVMEPEFRDLLFRDPAQALAGYELTEAEAASLAGVIPERFEAEAAGPERRSSQSRLMGYTSQSDAQKSTSP